MRAIIAYLTAKPGMEAKFKDAMTAQARRCLAKGGLPFDVCQDEDPRAVMEGARTTRHQGTRTACASDFRQAVSSWWPSAAGCHGRVRPESPA
jgi:hypothetical protein